MKSKIIFMIMTVAVVLPSCNKTYTCECTTTTTTSSGSTSSKTSYTSARKKDDASSWCQSYASTSSSGYGSSATAINTTCQLK